MIFFCSNFPFFYAHFTVERILSINNHYVKPMPKKITMLFKVGGSWVLIDFKDYLLRIPILIIVKRLPN